jgi:hypothetical protein
MLCFLRRPFIVVQWWLSPAEYLLKPPDVHDKGRDFLP